LEQSDQLSQLTAAMLQRVRDEQARLQQDIRSMTQKAIDDIRATINSASLNVDKSLTAGAAGAAAPAAAASPAAAAGAAAAAPAAGDKAPSAAAAAPAPAAPGKFLFLEMAESLHASVEGHRALASAGTLEQLSAELERSLNELTTEADADEDASADAGAGDGANADAGADAGAPPAAKAAGGKDAKAAAGGKKDAKAAAGAKDAKGKAGDGKDGKKGSAKKAVRGARFADGVVLQPAPGQPESPITLRRRDDIGGHPAFSRAVAGQHSWEENLRALLSEVDESEAKHKGLRLRMVEVRRKGGHSSMLLLLLRVARCLEACPPLPLGLKRDTPPPLPPNPCAEAKLSRLA